MNPVLGGAVAMASVVASLFFLRFWRDSKDRLFLHFSFAFAALAVNWLGLSQSPSGPETEVSVFLPRLVAFLSIIIAVVDKNRQARRSRG